MCFLAEIPWTMSYVGVMQPRCWWGQDWILPRKVIWAILAVSLILLLLGAVLLAMYVYYYYLYC